jgi:hypothetical protein
MAKSLVYECLLVEGKAGFDELEKGAAKDACSVG